MEILQLRYFLESAKSGSFAKTAEKYDVPATSVSASVKRLEKELGCELFDRSCNRIILNDKGRRFQLSVGAMFQELEQAVRSITPTDADNREIRILVRTTRTEITNAIIAYKEKHPLVAFKTMFDFSETDFEKYDIVIDDEKKAYADFEHFALLRTRIRVRACQTHPLSGRKLTFSMLKDQPFISIGEQSSLHKILIDACNKAGFTPNIAMSCNDIKCCEKCITAGVGIGLGREYANSSLPKGLVYLDVTDFNVTQTICCYYKKASAYGNIKDFLDYLRAKNGLR